MKYLEKKGLILIGIIFVLCMLSPMQFNFMDYNLIKDNNNNSGIPRVSNSDITISTPENKTYMEPMSGYYPATFGFENDANGQHPEGWVNQEYPIIEVISELNNHKKVLRLFDNTASYTSRVINSFSSKDNGTIELWIQQDDLTLAVNLGQISGWGNGNEIFRLKMVGGSSAKWQVRDNGVDIDVTGAPTPAINTWYHIQIDFEHTTGGYHGLGENEFYIYIDGIQYGPYLFGSDEALDELQLHTYIAGYLYDVYFDAVGYSWDPNYDIGDNNEEGLLLSFETTFTPQWLGYSLDGQINKTILGNKVIPLPELGKHSIQVFGFDNLMNIYSSSIRYFSIAPIAILTPEEKIYYEPMEGYYPAVYGFEGDDDGSDPDGWLINEDGGTVQILPSYYNHNKIVELHELIDDFTDIENIFGSRTNGTIECWAMVNRTDDWCSLGLYDGDTFDGIHMSFAGDGTIKYDNGVTWITIMPYSNYTWYHFKIEWDCATNWHVWINGVSGDGGTGYSFRNSPPSVDRVRFQISNFLEHRDQLMYVDAVGYSWDSNYNIGDNEDEGLLLSFETIFTPDWLGYSLDGQINKTISGNMTIPFPIDGLHTIQVFGNNSLGTNYQSIIQNFFVDTTSPVINIVSPSPDEFFGGTPPDFQISFTEQNLHSTWYYLGPGTNEIIFSGITGTINQTEWNKLGDGPVTIRFSINDTGGLGSFDEVIVQKDLTPPTSSMSFTLYITPNIVNISTTFSIAASDGTGSGATVLRYRINSSIWYDYTGPFDLSGYSYGYYLITYQAIDAVGNVESENELLVKLVEISSEAPAIPGFNIVLLLSVTGLVTLILIKRYKK